jgi:hypothetical protein
MAGLEGTVNTPFGPVKKKTGLIIVGGAVLILGIAYYRSKKAGDAAAIASAGASVGVDPATGFLYGSPEDAAALANQGSYVTPGGGGGGASVGGSGTVPTTGFATNGAWSQAAIQYMQAQGLIEDATMLSAALGRYLAGSPLSPTDKSLVEQAIAFQGLPPVPGTGGYPPSINTAPVPPPEVTPTTKKVNVLANWSLEQWVADLQAGKEGPIAAQTSWGDIVRLNGGPNGDLNLHTKYVNNPPRHIFTKSFYGILVGH